MATPPILFTYKNDYKPLPIITPKTSETIQGVTEVEKSEKVPEDPTANVVEESWLDNSRPLKFSWTTSQHVPFGIKLNFSVKNDTPVLEQEDAIIDAHVNAFQLPETSTAASKKNEYSLKKTSSLNSHKSSIQCVCGTKYTCLVHLKVPGINAPYLNLSPADLPSTSDEDDEVFIETDATPPLDSNSISMHFSHEMKTMLCAIFGDTETETDFAQSSEVEIPIWLCQQLYNAWKKQPVMENRMDIITKQDEALGLQYEEIARLPCKELNGFEGGYDPLALVQDSMTSHFALHEKYDKHSNPIIMKFLELFGNNLQLAVDTLQAIIDDQRRGSQYPKVPAEPYLKVMKSAASSATNAAPRAQEEPIIPLPTWHGKLHGEELKEHVHYLRQKAFFHINARNNLYTRAQESYADKKKRAASCVYSDMACGHHYQAENIQNEVVNNMLYITQKHRKLYLYFMTVDKALLALRTKLKFMKKAHPYVKELEVIIGYGKSMNNAAKIKPAVENWLFQKNINFHALNPGSIAVIMKSVPDNL